MYQTEREQKQVNKLKNIYHHYIETNSDKKLESAQSFKEGRAASRFCTNQQTRNKNKCNRSRSKENEIFPFNIQTNKDYRKTANIKKKIHQGNKERKIYLPDEDFTYGKQNDSSTPVKSVINYDFSNKAEEVIKMEYHTYLREVEVNINVLNIFNCREPRLINSSRNPQIISKNFQKLVK